MNKLSDCELWKEMEGRRVFRIELGGGTSLMVGVELEVDPGGISDLRRERAGDVAIMAGLSRAYALATDWEVSPGGKSE